LNEAVNGDIVGGSSEKYKVTGNRKEAAMKIAIVTGASSGMGREAVVQLADRFSRLEEIWVIARRKERLENLKGQVPVPLRIICLDLSLEQDLARLGEELKQQKPDVKILVNAAGYGKIGNVGSVDISQESGMVRVNCETLVRVTHQVLPYMSRHGRILQFASAAAFLPQPGFAVYAATKAFVLSYSRALGRELKGRDIRVTAVCPGPVRTEFFRIAETDSRMPAYKELFMADPRKVVEKAVQDSMMGKSVSIYGIPMKLFGLLCKVVPHEVILSAIPGKAKAGGAEEKREPEGQLTSIQQDSISGGPETEELSVPEAGGSLAAGEGVQK